MATATETRLCTRCKEKPAQGKDAYCADCRSAYQRDYRDNAEWRAERRGLIRGLQAMREYLSEYFKRSGRAFQGPEAASIIDSLPGPAVAPEDAKP